MEKPWLKHYEEGIPANLTYPSFPMHYFLEEAAAKYPENPVTIFGNGSKLDAKLTFRQLNDDVLLALMHVGHHPVTAQAGGGDGGQALA